MATLLDRLMAARMGLFGAPGLTPPNYAPPPNDGMGQALSRLHGMEFPTFDQFAQAPYANATRADPVQQIAQNGGGFMGGLNRLFAGGNDPRLTDAQNAAINEEALVNAGLGILAGSSSPVGTPSLGQAISKGALFSRHGAAASRDRAREEADKEAAKKSLADQQAIVSRALASGNVDHLQRARAQLAMAGNKDGADAIGSILSDMGVGATLTTVPQGDKETSLANSVTGDVVRTFHHPPDRKITTMDANDRIIAYYEDDPTDIVSVTWKGVGPDAAARIAADERKAALEAMRQPGGPLSSEQITNQNTLSDDYRLVSADAEDVENAVSVAVSLPLTKDAGATAATDLAMIMAYTRANDPGVSVRQDDVRNAREGGPLDEFGLRLAEKWNKGGLTDDDRRRLYNATMYAAQGHAESQQRVVERYINRGTRDMGLPREAVDAVVFNPLAPYDLSIIPDPSGPSGLSDEFRAELDAVRRRQGQR